MKRAITMLSFLAATLCVLSISQAQDLTVEGDGVVRPIDPVHAGTILDT